MSDTFSDIGGINDPDVFKLTKRDHSLSFNPLQPFNPLLPLAPGSLITLKVIGKRVPLNGDLYISKTGKLKRQKNTNYSTRAKQRNIVIEIWLA